MALVVGETCGNSRGCDFSYFIGRRRRLDESKGHRWRS